MEEVRRTKAQARGGDAQNMEIEDPAQKELATLEHDSKDSIGLRATWARIGLGLLPGASRSTARKS